MWIPEYRIAFSGDDFHGPFPNLYTLRGSRPRWPLEYVAAIERVLSWNPAVAAPSHEEPVYDEEIVTRMQRYGDAILHVHDATVQGMNAGEGVHTLMAEVALPSGLAVDETYGAVHWSVRGIYEGYLGWFDGNVANMYPTPASAVHRDLVELAGGPAAVAGPGSELPADGDPERALRMADVVLTDAPDDPAALTLRRDALQVLLDRSLNTNETGWLQTALNETEARLQQ